MERNVYEYLGETSTDELLSRGVVSAQGQVRTRAPGQARCLPDASDAGPGVTKLTFNDRDWHLTVDGTFSNPKSREFKSGAFERLEGPGNVFRDQNVHINPHYFQNPR